MQKKRNKLLEKPQVRQKLDEAVHIARVIKEKNPLAVKGLREMMANDEISSAMEDILEVSPMSQQMKIYIRSVFIDKLSKKKSIQKAFGKDLGYQEEAIAGSIMENPAVKEFVDLIKEFYINVAPIAALKEMDIMLTTKNEEVALKAARQIKEGAGIGVEQKEGNHLPVRIVINMPQQHNTQIVMPKTEEKKDDK